MMTVAQLIELLQRCDGAQHVFLEHDESGTYDAHGIMRVERLRFKNGRLYEVGDWRLRMLAEQPRDTERGIVVM